MSERKIILASASPARKSLLEQLGLNFEVDKSNFEENLTQALSPAELVLNLAEGKACDVAARYNDAIVIGADTVITFNDEILGKPHTSQRAVEMLNKMNGKMHKVISGFVIIDTASGKKISDFEETRVYFNYLSGEEIESYVAREKPLQKAGAYSIQDLGAALVERIDGDYYAVVGLPLTKFSRALREMGVEIL